VDARTTTEVTRPPTTAAGAATRLATAVTLGRLVLAAVAVRQALAATRELPGGGQPIAELAAWQVAAAAGLLTVAARPGAAEALLPLLAAAGLLTAAVSVRGVADGVTTADRETGHLWFEVGLAVATLLWILVQGRPPPVRPPRSR
jgi:predicted anti-sigma-YlaC factor YlaD